MLKAINCDSHLSPHFSFVSHLLFEFVLFVCVCVQLLRMHLTESKRSKTKSRTECPRRKRTEMIARVRALAMGGGFDFFKILPSLVVLFNQRGWVNQSTLSSSIVHYFFPVNFIIFLYPIFQTKFDTNVFEWLKQSCRSFRKRGIADSRGRNSPPPHKLKASDDLVCPVWWSLEAFYFSSSSSSSSF